MKFNKNRNADTADLDTMANTEICLVFISESVALNFMAVFQIYNFLIKFFTGLKSLFVELFKCESFLMINKISLLWKVLII